jgi:hypothetical protein
VLFGGDSLGLMASREVFGKPLKIKQSNRPLNPQNIDSFMKRKLIERSLVFLF